MVHAAMLWLLWLGLATRCAAQFFQFQQGSGGINLEDLMGGGFGGGGFGGGGGYEELPQEEEEEEVRARARTRQARARTRTRRAPPRQRLRPARRWTCTSGSNFSRRRATATSSRRTGK